MNNTSSRLAAVLSFEGIPAKQRAKYLETQCGIPEFNAFRLLGRIDPILPTTLVALANGLKVSESWLGKGEVGSNHLRDLEIFLYCHGHDIAEAPRLFRLQQDFLTEDPIAREYFALFRPGQFNLIKVARLYDDHLKRTRLKLVRPVQIPTERDAALQELRDALHDLGTIVRRYVSVFRTIAQVILNLIPTQITLKGGSGRGNGQSDRNADGGNDFQKTGCSKERRRIMTTNVLIPDSETKTIYETSPAAEPSDSATEPVPAKSVEVREIEYYDDTWDSSNYLVCFDRHYIFAIRPNDPEPKWEFLQPDSSRWDSVHQRVYRNFGADRINRDQIPAKLPPPPDSIAPELLIPPPPPPPEIFLRANYAYLDDHLQKRDGAVPVFLVLLEDLYESRNGDGKFHYPEKLFFREKDAYSLKDRSDDTYAFHVRAGLVWLDGETIGCKMPCRTFDHFSYADVLRMAEANLATEANG
jgi:hypothetical protein